MLENQNNADEHSNGFLIRHVHVTGELGLHARPAAKLAQEAQKFECTIVLQTAGQEVDAKSILDILTLAAAPGTNLVLRAKGDDASEALDRLESLFHNQFEED
jgi:phosphocarrier protein